MSLVGLSEAAKITGRNQSIIHRAMKNGRLSYSVSAGGERQIDTAELERAFGMQGNGAMPNASAHASKSHVTQGREVALLQQQLEDRDATIRDLRARLDAESEERRRVQGQLTALLTDQRPSPPPANRWTRFMAWRRGR